ncbi:MAG: ORF6N domain-containing protein [Candidatus Sumerlaeota bacterium]|nr:ORF6N domain-containing protein [Candidatus Sumerlaeota bacterium]
MNQAVRRNRKRFPVDFAFPLIPEEKAQVITNCDHLARLRFSKTLPTAFTEHGAIMAATILNTDRAVVMSVLVVRAFVQLRSMLAAHKELAGKVAQLERRVSTHDQHIVALFDAIKRLMAPPPVPKRRPIGFLPPEQDET